jgi:hypothetical protein
MRKLPVAALLLLCGSWVPPASAEIFVVTLHNGGTFESRHEPRQAAWDAGMLELITDTGLPIALPKSLVREVTAQSETKGFGRVLNTTTVDLGFAPNDVVEAEKGAGRPPSVMEQAFTDRIFDTQQFAEPSQAGVHAPSGGIPVSSLGGYGGGGGGAAVPSAPVAPRPSAPPAAPPSGSGSGSSQ